jgi:hypothetical protein
MLFVAQEVNGIAKEVYCGKNGLKEGFLLLAGQVLLGSLAEDSRYPHK